MRKTPLPMTPVSPHMTETKKAERCRAAMSADRRRADNRGKRKTRVAAFSASRADLPGADAAGNRAHPTVRRDRKLQARRKAVRDRQARSGNVRRVVGPCRDHPARRPRSCHARDRSGARPVSRRNRPALGPGRAGRWPRRGRRRDLADSAGAVARAAGGGSRSRRAHHARADPAPGQPDPGRRRRPGADRPVEFERRHPPAGISHPQRLSASSARSRHRS